MKLFWRNTKRRRIGKIRRGKLIEEKKGRKGNN